MIKHHDTRNVILNDVDEAKHATEEIKRKVKDAKRFGIVEWKVMNRGRRRQDIALTGYLCKRKELKTVSHSATIDVSPERILLIGLRATGQKGRVFYYDQHWTQSGLE